MNSLAVNLRRRVLPSSVRSSLHRAWYRLRPPTIEQGVGRGLRFDPGPSNPEYARGSNERPVQDALASIAGEGSVVFDVGANVGFFTVLAAHLVGPIGQVVAFEPVPSNAGYVRRNAALNRLDNVSVVEKAVGDRVGRASLTLARFSGGAVLTHAGRPPDAAETIEVDIISIDQAVSTGAVPVPEVIKIDVEGAELDVFRGLEKTMRDHRPTIICEVDAASESTAAETLSACTDFVTQRGYQVSMLEDSYEGAGWAVHHFVAAPPSID